MRRMLIIALLCLLPAGLQGQRPAFSGEPAELVIIAHPGAPVDDLTRADLEDIFTTKRRFWSGGKRVIPFNLPPRHPFRVTFDRVVLLRDADEVGRLWVDRRVRGGNPPPRRVDNAKVMLAAIRRLPGSIGYIPARYMTDSMNDAVIVVARIRDDHLIFEPRPTSSR